MQYFGWPLGGASIAVDVEYVNEGIRRFTDVRPAAAVVVRRFRKALAGLKLFHLIGGITMLKYGRRSHREIQFFLRRLRKSFVNRDLRRLRPRQNQ